MFVRLCESPTLRDASLTYKSYGKMTIFNIDHTPFENETDYIHCLQIDHINGKGKREINSFSYNRAYYKFVLAQLKAGSKDYQLLCANCNWLKRYKNKEQ
jgi:hypothetical protein